MDALRKSNDRSPVLLESKAVSAELKTAIGLFFLADSDQAKADAGELDDLHDRCFLAIEETNPGDAGSTKARG